MKAEAVLTLDEQLLMTSQWHSFRVLMAVMFIYTETTAHDRRCMPLHLAGRILKHYVQCESLKSEWEQI
jgi:hypothetical protein